MLELRIAGPQFGDPWLIMTWLGLRYGRKPTLRRLSEADCLHEITGSEGGTPVHVLGARPAIWDRALVYDSLFPGADGALIVFTRLAPLLRLNRPEYDALLPYLRALRRPPVLLANDARCNDPEFRPVPATQVAAELGVMVHQTTLGPFIGHLQHDEGVAEAWDSLVAAAHTPEHA